MPHALEILEATEGGTRRHLRDLSLGLLARGWKVTLAVSCDRDPDFAAADIPLLLGAGAAVRVVPMKRGISPAADWKACRALSRLVAEARPDIVHTHSSKAGILGRAAARAAGVPAVHTPHCFAFEMGVSAARRLLYRAIERRAAKWTAAFAATCEAEARAARALAEGPAVVVIHNGIEAAAPAPKAARRESGGDSSGGGDAAPARREFDAVFIGRYCEQKAPEIFVASCAKVLGERPDARFAMMGQGKMPFAARREFARCEALRRAVEIMPQGGGSDVAGLLRSARMLVAPSRWEGFPYLVLEAMAEATPIVASEVGGVGEAARDGVEALLVPAGDTAATAAAMLRLMDDGALRARLAAAGPQRAASFPLAGMVGRIERLYLDVIAGSRSVGFDAKRG